MADYQMFANRLAKNFKHISKWARRQGITCFRIYDHDIPQFPFAIDKYEEYIHVSEYETGYYMEEDEREAWFLQCLTQIALQTSVTIDNIFLKKRQQQRGKKQYDKNITESFEAIGHENGLKFKLNLTDYLDTGLFLDHRPLRAKVQSIAEGKNVLNLFAYTGSFSVYAAAANAKLVVTIDLSNTYLKWAKENLELNEVFDEDRHFFVQDDVREWLESPPQNTKFDIIIMDPPTFSNSKRMEGVLDIQRDYIELINNALYLLNPNGILYFSTNFRRFKLDSSALNTDKIKDITLATIPDDFRDKKIHYCFEIRK